MIALAFVGLATSSMAQDYNVVPTKKYSVATNSFWANWFISVGGQYQASRVPNSKACNSILM